MTSLRIRLIGFVAALLFMVLSAPLLIGGAWIGTCTGWGSLHTVEGVSKQIFRVRNGQGAAFIVRLSNGQEIPCFFSKLPPGNPPDTPFEARVWPSRYPFWALVPDPRKDGIRILFLILSGGLVAGVGLLAAWRVVQGKIIRDEA